MKYLFKLKKSTYHHWNKSIDNEDKNYYLKLLIKKICLSNTAYGIRRVQACLISQYNEKHNRKKIERLYREMNLQLPIKKNRKKNYEKTCTNKTPEAMYANHLWAMDFMFDNDKNGNKIKILNIIDVYSKKCLCIFGDSSINAFKLSSIIMELFKKYGYPKAIISDNGSEFRAKITNRTLKNYRVDQIFIQPGKPWQNGYVESFNSRIREEFLNRNIFNNFTDFKAKAVIFKDYFNLERPHSALNYKTPDSVFKIAA